MNKPEPLRAYFGHHKCASSWISSIMFEVCQELQWKYRIVDSAETFEYELNSHLTNNGIDFLSYINAEMQYVKDIDNFLGFHVIRDPRDIIVSGYFSHLYSHPTENWPALLEHRNRLKEVDKEEGLFLEMKFSKDKFEDLYKWDYSQKNVLELKMEEMIRSPYKSILEAMTFLDMIDDSPRIKFRVKSLLISIVNRIHEKSSGWILSGIKRTKIPVERLLMHVYQNRFSKLSEGRNRGQEDIKSHYRKGVAGDWINHFNQEHIQFFKDEYNDLLIKLGYEDSLDW